ncbi:MAG: trehalose-6-phosphate synthase [Proteobacteria bacterium]|nr:MAG: trehalose-6-phosphate synthase [Pseudomonadota bacterium]MBC6945540.1 trehalose-6-phosphate synthase [Gammaproteobacteria bacterium]MCQ3933323.1 trehalose-6-phosphate synthase [Gammaproteobacteria bacterium]MDL1880644.1 trehalose-6-phosphate synthase [Gammaproteobacteria bacterium PRO2]
MIVVSNRLPWMVRRDRAGVPRLVAGSGGLVSAMAPVLAARGGTWIGGADFCGQDAQLAAELCAAGRRAGYELRPLFLDEQERRGFYHGFSNEVLWPLFHDLTSLCRFEPSYWQAYCVVNRRFAAEVGQAATPGDLVWVHDYQLMLVGAGLRDMGIAGPLAFFLHIPFPPPDIFMKLPWRRELLDALLAYDLLGFQAPRDRRNFTDCVRDLLPEVKISGRGEHFVRLRTGSRELRAGRFPIGIDYNDFYRRAAAPGVVREAAAMRRLLHDRQLVLGVDRLDYTKGIPERLQAFGLALERHPELREKVTLVQVVVPSREDIPRYRELKARIENLVGSINGRFTRPGGWVPIHYVFRNLAPDDLLSYYRAAQIALITPLKDGMNLVAKEYCAASPDEDCVLVLSEFAGAAAAMAGAALLVNPHDVTAVADAIATACAMPASERRARMRRLRRGVRRHDVFWWVDAFVRAAIAPSGRPSGEVAGMPGALPPPRRRRRGPGEGNEGAPLIR